MDSLRLTAFQGGKAPPARRQPTDPQRARIAELEAALAAMTKERDQLQAFVSDALTSIRAKADEDAKARERAAIEARSAAEQCSAVLRQDVQREQGARAELCKDIDVLRQESSRQIAAVLDLGKAVSALTTNIQKATAIKPTPTPAQPSAHAAKPVSGKRNYSVLVTERDGNGYGQRFSITSTER